MKDVMERSTHRTVLQELIEGNLPQSEKDSVCLMGEASVVVAAGVVTTGWTLSTAAFHIINNRPVFQKLRAELEAAIPDPDVKPSWTELEKLPYLAGCVREGVRLSYRVTAQEPRLLSKPLEYKGWIIPPRTPVSMTNVNVCDDEEIFPEPRTFRPERGIGSQKGTQRAEPGEVLSWLWRRYTKLSWHQVSSHRPQYTNHLLTPAPVFHRPSFI